MGSPNDGQEGEAAAQGTSTNDCLERRGDRVQSPWEVICPAQRDSERQQSQEDMNKHRERAVWRLCGAGGSGHDPVSGA